MEKVISAWISTFGRVIELYVRAIGSAVEDFARGVSIFPTLFADTLMGALHWAGPRRRQGGEDFNARITQLAGQLKTSGANAQTLLEELEQVMELRRQQFTDAQLRLQQLEHEEEAISARVQALKNVPPESASAITDLLDESLNDRERRGAKRDWIIFAAGVVASAIVSYLLDVFWG